jgi:hypothetical protein
VTTSKKLCYHKEGVIDEKVQEEKAVEPVEYIYIYRGKR